MENTKKSRNLSVAEYFLVIQREYLIADFRRKIYFSKNDKNYYQRVMNGKREKIECIARRNNLDSIFNNVSKMEERRCELFDKSGKPKFQMTSADVENYYAPGNEFSLHGDIWTLDSVNTDGTLVLSNSTKQSVIADKSEVCRIL